MLSLLRTAPGRAPSFRQCLASRVRQYARVADTADQAISSEENALTIAPPGGLPDDSTTAISALPRRQIKKYQVDVKPEHGLYGFFRKVQDDLGEDVTYRTVEPPEGEALFPSGRAWKASELRLKSFQDLHTLWYIVLRERNLLATQKEEARRMGIQNPSAWGSTKKATLCRKTMARIKYVLNERRLAYEGAVKLVEAEAEEVSALKEDEKVLKHQLQEWRKGRSLRKAARRLSRRAQDSLVSAPVEDATTSPEIPVETSAETPTTTESTIEAEPSPSATPETSVQPPDPVDVKAEDSPAVVATEKAKTRSERKAERRKKETEELLAKEAPEGIDAVESSLFGGPSSGKKRP
ncbi:Large ribosomal subunit protein uL29m [Pleurotus pulmonarius]